MHYFFNWWVGTNPWISIQSELVLAWSDVTQYHIQHNCEKCMIFFLLTKDELCLELIDKLWDVLWVFWRQLSWTHRQVLRCPWWIFWRQLTYIWGIKWTSSAEIFPWDKRTSALIVMQISFHCINLDEQDISDISCLQTIDFCHHIMVKSH